MWKISGVMLARLRSFFGFTTNLPQKPTCSTIMSNPENVWARPKPQAFLTEREFPPHDRNHDTPKSNSGISKTKRRRTKKRNKAEAGDVQKRIATHINDAIHSNDAILLHRDRNRNHHLTFSEFDTAPHIHRRPPVDRDPQNNNNASVRSNVDYREFRSNDYSQRLQPSPDVLYLEKSLQQCSELSEPSQLLIILDLNGALMYRKGTKTPPRLRPHLPEFLDYLFRNFNVMVWTSARPENALRLVRAAFTEEQHRKLVAIWARDTLGLNEAQYAQKVQVYKRLTRVWEGEFMIPHPLQPNKIYDQTNTVLLDDSLLKAAYQPYNVLNLSEFTGTIDEIRNDCALQSCIQYLEILKWKSNVSSFMRMTPFKMPDIS
ncbi:HAD-like domain-containing protein [Geopyxis carbonaria]|nr:HAD-like domain-containing protein [Geopyxis carbonaria]